MRLKAKSAVTLLLCITGCSVAPPVVKAPSDLWQDDAFEYSSELVTVTKTSLFRLDDELLSQLRERNIYNAHTDTRVAFLMSSLFGPEMKNFGYRGGHSTSAAETWRNRSGDCLSLTVLTMSLATALDLPVHMQEVQVPVSFDRRGGVDFLNQHVNVLLRVDRPFRLAGRTVGAGNIVIDFEPQIGSNRRGRILSDDAILARYYNNIAAEHLAHRRDRLAYVHFRAAIDAEPGFSSAYNNLAQLYLQAGLVHAAERLLRHAVAINGDSYLALSALHDLLSAQGRETEARRYQQLLLARRGQDPYYWLGLGLAHLQAGKVVDAVAALEQAQALTTGFEEVHQFLAVAYWRSGKAHKARDQLAVLGALTDGSPSVAALSKKFKGKIELPQTERPE